MRALNIGYGNYIACRRILSVLQPDSAPVKRLKEEARSKGKLIDATQGRRTRALIVLDTGHLVLSGIQTDTLVQRLNGQEMINHDK